MNGRWKNHRICSNEIYAHWSLTCSCVNFWRRAWKGALDSSGNASSGNVALPEGASAVACFVGSFWVWPNNRTLSTLQIQQKHVICPMMYVVHLTSYSSSRSIWINLEPPSDSINVVLSFDWHCLWLWILLCDWQSVQGHSLPRLGENVANNEVWTLWFTLMHVYVRYCNVHGPCDLGLFGESDPPALWALLSATSKAQGPSSGCSWAAGAWWERFHTVTQMNPMQKQICRYL